jgi:small-conductance mechanosensitive channel
MDKTAAARTFLGEADLLQRIQLLDYEVMGNSLRAYVVALGVFAAVWALLYCLYKYVVVRIVRYAVAHGGPVVKLAGLLEGISAYVFPLLALYIAVQRLGVSAPVERAVRLLALGAVMIQVARIASELLAHTITRLRGRQDDPVVKATNVNIVALIKVAVWVAATLFLLDNMGLNIGTFVAGLGIGGIAIALAAQAILGDTFSSFAIALDKPFEVGDFIEVDGLQGNVELIGLKTTRIRSLSGELLIFANSDLTRSRIKNYKRMYERRVSFKIGVLYETSADLLRRIPKILEEAVAKHDKARFDRAHFLTFADSSLDFEVVFFVKHPDYRVYADIHQAINLDVFERFAAEGIEFAYPTQRTVVLEQDSGFAGAFVGSNKRAEPDGRPRSQPVS